MSRGGIASAGLQRATSQARQQEEFQDGSLLDAVEGTHAYAIIQGAINKLLLVGVIAVDPQAQAQELTQNVGEEISRMIAEQKALEDRFQQLIEQQHQLRSQVNKAKLKENQQQVAEVAELLRQSTMQLCRNLKENPNVAENIAKVATERQSLQQLLNQCLNEITVYRSVQSLEEMVQREERREVEVAETIERERQTTSAVRSLKTTIRDEKSDHKELMKTQKKTHSQLKEELQTAKQETFVQSRFRDKESEGLNGRLRLLEDLDLYDLEQEIERLEKEIALERKVHGQLTGYLRKRASAKQEKALEWGQRFESDTQALDRKLEQLDQNYKKDLERRNEMEVKYNEELALKKDRDARLVAKAFAALFQEEGMKERMTRAAMRLQAFWRGFKAREAVGTKKKGGKKKGKKK